MIALVSIKEFLSSSLSKSLISWECPPSLGSSSVLAYSTFISGKISNAENDSDAALLLSCIYDCVSFTVTSSRCFYSL